MISDQAVKEYQEIFHSQFKQDITLEEAKEQGTRLLSLLLLIATLKKENTEPVVSIYQKDRENLH